MDLVASLPAFLVAVLLISASPGPAMALILRRASLHGFQSAVATVLGLEAGLYAWALLAAAGFAALVAASGVAFVVLRVVGATVLVYLGVRAWREAWKARHEDPSAAGRPIAVDAAPKAAPTGGPGTLRAFAEGFVVQLANPKAAVFMLAFYPQFVPAERPLFATTAALALLQVIVETAFYLTLAAGFARAGAWLRRPRIRRRVEAVTGTVLIALGLRVAITSS